MTRPQRSLNKETTCLQKKGRKPGSLTCALPRKKIQTGTALTCLALYNAFRANRRGNHEQVQRMFRARIWAQTFTVIAMVAGGAYYGKDREKRAELVKLEAQQRAEERHARWLHELEIRDQEERDLQEAMRKRKERVEARRAAGVEKDKTTGPQDEAAASAAAADEKEGGDGGGGGGVHRGSGRLGR